MINAQLGSDQFPKKKKADSHRSTLKTHTLPLIARLHQDKEAGRVYRIKNRTEQKIKAADTGVTDLFGLKLPIFNTLRFTELSEVNRTICVAESRKTHTKNP